MAGLDSAARFLPMDNEFKKGATGDVVANRCVMLCHTPLPICAQEGTEAGPVLGLLERELPAEEISGIGRDVARKPEKQLV